MKRDLDDHVAIAHNEERAPVPLETILLPELGDSGKGSRESSEESEFQRPDDRLTSNSHPIFSGVKVLAGIFGLHPRGERF